MDYKLMSLSEGITLRKAYSKHAPVGCSTLSTNQVVSLLKLINVFKWLSLIDD